MKWTLEVIVVPVTDLARAREFYAEKLGFAVDHDTRISEDVHIVQLTPPGSGCSIVISKGMSQMAPGSLKGVQLVVGDLRAAHAQLIERGVPVSEVQVAGAEGFRQATAEDDLNNQGFVFFDDPDGNSWAVQQITSRGLD
ncbi:VOC family protein [Crossiella cryophila]|uniref:Catechol 2,3-dioxygenase-like lactoylglutathione lyase family enzyme n=1 Tax=Crossiella cryophila TaxID=43355 RepID=A0A7W7CE12_9PSEU|nr:VOC family protein [Crossiella cryophila]MBB4677824.1 catechol 2,3-dioxygenase-like lactoylglutathione lyase family enzyme [Crossiella cryophila]